MFSMAFNLALFYFLILAFSSRRILFPFAVLFFMYLAYLAPHDPRTMPESFKKMYDPEKIKLPPNFQEIIDTNYPLMVHRDEHLAEYPRKPEEVKRHIAEYFAMITHLDFEIGRLLDALHQSGEEDNTIIVFTGDNGLAVRSMSKPHREYASRYRILS